MSSIGQYRPITPAAQEGAENGEQHQAVEQHPSASPHDTPAALQQATKQGTYPGKAGN